MLKEKEKMVRIQTKGMITIPVEFRNKLNITENSIMKAEIKDQKIVLSKVTSDTDMFEMYNDKQITQWLKADQLDAKTAKSLKKLLGK